MAKFDEAIAAYLKALKLETSVCYKKRYEVLIKETIDEKTKIAELKKRFKEEGWDALEGLSPNDTLNVMCGIYEGTDLYKNFMEDRVRERGIKEQEV